MTRKKGAKEEIRAFHRAAREGHRRARARRDGRPAEAGAVRDVA
jgi:hypothetical protein